MSKTVKSQALEVLNQVLGLAGPQGGATQTQLDDDNLYQTIDVGPIARRSRAATLNEGLFFVIMQNIHAAANTQSSSWGPFKIETAGTFFPPFPNPITRGFDLWLIGATIEQDSGSGTLTAALNVFFPPAFQGFGIDSADAGVTDAIHMPVANWDALVTVNDEFGTVPGGGSFARIGMRLPRAVGVEMRFSSVSSAAATFNLQIIMGLFPSALGQDVLV